MSILKKILSLSFSFFIFVACTTQPENKMRDWSQGMQGMAKALEELAPYLYDKEQFADAANRKMISHSLTQLKNSSGYLDLHYANRIGQGDPLFAVGVKGLQSQIQSAYESFTMEDPDYSRSLLRQSTHFCFQCHLQSKIGVRVVRWDPFQSFTEKMGATEKIRYWVATRQFDRAIQFLRKEIFSPAQKTPKGVMEKFQLIVYLQFWHTGQIDDVKRTLHQALGINHFEKEKEIIKNWINDLDAKKFPHQNNKKVMVRSAQAFLKNLRMAKKTHDLFKSQPRSKKNAERLYHLGRFYDSYPGLGFSPLAEVYFQNCVKWRPGSELAKKCVYSYKRKVKKRYTNRAIPDFYGRSIQRLERMALTEPKQIFPTEMGSDDGDSDDW
ncbi:MAG: hypothetical protein AAF203_10115 [Pseudomonadota bacterium]